MGGPIRWRMHLEVPPEVVYQTLDSDGGRASFWAESATESDGVIDFRFIDGSTCTSRIVERRPSRLWVIEYMESLARFELSEDGRGGTDLLLINDGVESEEWIEMHAGWLNVLFPLKAWVTHGVDLRNHDPRRTWNEGFADQ